MYEFKNGLSVLENVYTGLLWNMSDDIMPREKRVEAINLYFEIRGLLYDNGITMNPDDSLGGYRMEFCND